MNTTNWKHYYSIDPVGNRSSTGAIYEPLMNDDGSILCLNFNNNSYREKVVEEELLEACFMREKRFLLKFQKYNWCAEILHINEAERKIYIEWNTECCDKIINTRKQLPENFSEQLEIITKDLKSEEVYKTSMYPCYHFVKNDTLKTFGFYTASDYSEQPMNIDLYRPILNETRSRFVDTIIENGKVDFSIFNRYSFLEFIKWPGDPLPGIYDRVYRSN